MYAGVKVKIKRENRRVLKGRFSGGEGAFRKVDGADAKEVVRNGKGRGRDRGREEGETKGERGRRERGENGAKQEEDGGRRDGGKFSRVRGKLSEGGGEKFKGEGGVVGRNGFGPVRVSVSEKVEARLIVNQRDEKRVEQVERLEGGVVGREGRKASPPEGKEGDLRRDMDERLPSLFNDVPVAVVSSTNVAVKVG